MTTTEDNDRFDDLLDHENEPLPFSDLELELEPPSRLDIPGAGLRPQTPDRPDEAA